MKQQPTDKLAMVLVGWKQIAQYMEMAVRTVQRYERNCGLPVRRASHKSRGLVIATKEELDGWVRARPLAHAFALRHRILDVASLKSFRTALAEQRQLREEMSKMREELHTTVRILHETIGSWHEDFTGTPPIEKHGKIN